jgi:hypothetical protein
VLIGAVHVCHCRVMQLLPSYGSDYHNRRLILQPQLARAFSLGFNRLLSDIFWLMFAQYYGDQSACKQEKYRYAADYLRLIVELDPHFIRPYWYAAFTLAGDKLDNCRKTGDRAGAIVALSEAQQLLDAGIRSNPDDWTLPYIAGFSQYIFARNDRSAAHYCRIAARVPGAPPWLNKLAVIMDSGVASRTRINAQTWQLTYYCSQDASVREHARKQLQIIWSQVYYMAKASHLDNIVRRALSRLKDFEVTLLPAEKLPRSVETPGSGELQLVQ